MRWLACAVIVALWAGGAEAADPAAWSVGKNGDVCEADAPQPDGTVLTIAPMGPQYFLMMQSGDFPTAKQSAKVSIRIDDGAAIATEALGSDHIYAVAITPQIGMPLRAATRMTAVINGKTYAFAFRPPDQAMDEVGRCAGIRTLPEIWSDAPKEIAGAPEWYLIEQLPGTNSCAVRRNSTEVNTSLSLTKDGSILLVAGRPDWAKTSGEVPATLQIDQAAPVEVTAFVFQNVVFVPVKEPLREQQIAGAKVLRWHFPWGDFSAEVSGLGVAVEALRHCAAGKAAKG